MVSYMTALGLLWHIIKEVSCMTQPGLFRIVTIAGSSSADNHVEYQHSSFIFSLISDSHQN